MTKSILGKINLTKKHNDIIRHVVSSEHLNKIKQCEDTRHKRTSSIIKNQPSEKLKSFLSAVA
ncbi:MAG: hypothetical protein DRG78_17125 [Epsilonproteobacteria bacterium]|nr:MAG: hypothetical protein DRG78_17125 [Campylobacterota bacterium]